MELQVVALGVEHIDGVTAVAFDAAVVFAQRSGGLERVVVIFPRHVESLVKNAVLLEGIALDGPGSFEKHYVERYDPAKAKFRTFLRTCLDRFVQNHQKAERAETRGGGQPHLPLDFPGAEQELAATAMQDRADLDRFFHDETVRALFARTVDAMRRAYDAEGKRVIFRVFERHDLHPSPDLTYASVAREFNLTAAQVTNYLHAARRRFREQTLINLRALVGTDEEFRDEARALFGLEIA